MDSESTPQSGACAYCILRYPAAIVVAWLLILASPNTWSASIRPAAEAILAGARLHIPTEETWIRGDLRVRPSDSRSARKLHVEMSVKRRADTTIAEYTISDAFGRKIEQLTISRTDAGETGYRHVQGSAPARVVHSLYDRIQDADVSWIDMSLEFLWWDDPMWIREDSVKGHACHVIDVPAPRLDANGYSIVRLWIEKKSNALLRAEAFGSEGNLVRQFSVRSLKKINGRWMVKSLDFVTYPTRDRTRLHVREVRTADAQDDVGDDALPDLN